MEYDVYHGRTVTDPTFDLKYVGNEEANDQYGPGFYFTNDIEMASGYAGDSGIVIKATVTIDNLLTDNEDLTEDEVMFMIKNCPSVLEMAEHEEDTDEYLESFYETPLSDFAEDFESALYMAVDGYVGRAKLDGMHLLWRDFYKYDPDDYLRNLIKLGYDGNLFRHEDGKLILVVYSPENINVTAVKNIKDISLTESLRDFIELHKRDGNKPLVESILNGFDVIFENDRAGGKSLADYPKFQYISKVTVYRARDVKDNSFLPDDYITLSPKFAIEHAENNHVYSDEPHMVIRARVPTKDVVDATNPGEYLYKGEPLKGEVAYVTKGPYDYEGDIPNIKRTNLRFPVETPIVESDESMLQRDLSIVGDEKEYRVSDDLVKLVDQYGSTRYIKYDDENPIAAIQVMSHPKLGDVVSNLFVLPDYRRSGLATKLFNIAKHDFPNLKHNEYLTKDGEKFVSSFNESKEPWYPPRKKLYFSKLSKREKMMLTMIRVFDSLSDQNKSRYIRDYLPNGIEMAVHSLKQLDDTKLTRLKASLKGIRNEEKQKSDSLKRERKAARDEKQMGKAYEEQEALSELDKLKSRKEQQELLDHQITSGELDKDELDKMRKDGIIDENNQYIHIDEIDNSLIGKAEKHLRKGESKGSKLSGAMADVVKGVGEMKRGISKKNSLF